MSLNSEERKQVIIDNSLKLFTEKGFVGVTTTEIALTSGINTGSLFYIFENKDNLIKELYLYCRDVLLDAIISKNGSDNFKDSLFASWRNLLSFSLDNYEIIRYLYIYYTSPYYTEQLSDEERYKSANIFAELYQDKMDSIDKIIRFNILVQYVIHFDMLVVEKIRAYPEYEDLIKSKAENVLWGGISSYY